MDYKNKYLKYKNKYLTLKQLQNGGSYGYVMGPEIKDITEFMNVDVRDTLNEPAIAALLNGTMPQLDVNKHLLTATVTIFNRIKEKRSRAISSTNVSQNGGSYGYVMGPEIKDITEFKNVDVRDTLNEPALAALLNGSMPQLDVNKHLLTAIVTVYNLVKDVKSQTGGSYGYIMGPEMKDITEFKNVDVADTLNEPAVAALLNGLMPQEDVNKHLLTAIVAVNNNINL
jgi:Trp operon repressor